jgi:rare lipoprotein A
MALKVSQLFWIALFVCVLTVIGGERAEARVVLASWYGPGFEGLPTASGEPYNPYGYTAAHKRLPFGTQLQVYYRGRSVQVIVNDRGPYVGARKLDLSQGAASSIGLIRNGVDYVDYYIVGSSSAGYGTSYSAPAAGGGYYVVRPGDTLTGLAYRFGTTVAYLAAVNGIVDPDYIYSGQTISY